MPQLHNWGIFMSGLLTVNHAIGVNIIHRLFSELLGFWLNRSDAVFRFAKVSWVAVLSAVYGWVDGVVSLREGALFVGNFVSNGSHGVTASQNGCQQSNDSDVFHDVYL